MCKQSVIFQCSSHLGYKRTVNEDAYGAYPELGLWVIADGMGGHNNGSAASHLAVAEVLAQIQAGQPLITAIQHSHQAILLAGKTHPLNEGMGSTVVALKLNGQYYEIAAVGDSRAYLFSNNTLRQITHDHTFVQDLINQGQITDEQAKIHPYRNILTQALGSTHHKEVMVDIFTGQMHRGDQLLLCTDGLTNRIQDYKIARLLTESKSLAEAIDNLISMALAFGGQDNITVALIEQV
jgi:protein phosphatase